MSPADFKAACGARLLATEAPGDPPPHQRTEDLLPCPFCGSRDLELTNWVLDFDAEDGLDEHAAVECHGCLTQALLTVWNNRAPTATTD